MGCCDPKSFAMIGRMLCKSNCLVGELGVGSKCAFREQVSYSIVATWNMQDTEDAVLNTNQHDKEMAEELEIEELIFLPITMDRLTPKYSYDERVWLTVSKFGRLRASEETTETNKQLGFS